MKRNEKTKKTKRKKIIGIFLIGIGCCSILLGMKNKSIDSFSINNEKFIGYKIKEIIENKDVYPQELVELALKKEETVDFVYNYNKNIKDKNKINIDKEYIEGQFPLFIQWDERWGYDRYGDTYIAINGCGPTNLAMVIVGLTGDTSITPKVVADFSVQNGYYVENVGTSWSLLTEGAKAFGIQGEEIPLSEKSILSALEKGQPIIASMKPGDFTTSGHFILMTGITEDGKIIVNGSDSRKRSNITWDLDVIMGQVKGLWKFYI